MLMKGINESRNVVNQHQTDTIYSNDRRGQMQFHVFQKWFKNNNKKADAKVNKTETENIAMHENSAECRDWTKH